MDFKQKSILIILGFALTTVCGGLLATYFQHRSWQHQWNVQRIEREIEISREAFARISSLVDKRNYRTRKLIWALKGQTIEGEIDLRLREYADLLFEWNDNLNSNYATAQVYFGGEIRDFLENRISAGFIDIGFNVECELQRVMSKPVSQKCQGQTLKKAEEELEKLGYEIYEFNLKMLESIKKKDNDIYSLRFVLF